MATTYETILTAAYTMFAQEGFEKTSLARIAERVGISKPALFYHFRSKEQLFEVLFGIIVERIRADTRVDFSDVTADRFRDTLIGLGLEDIRALRDDPTLGPALMQFSLLGLRNETIAALNREVEMCTRRKFEGIVEHGLNIGCIPSDSPTASLGILCAIVSTGISEEMIRHPDGEYENLWETFVTGMFP